MGPGVVLLVVFLHKWHCLIFTSKGSQIHLILARRKAERAEALAFERQRLWKVRQQERQETKASCEALKEELLPPGCGSSRAPCDSCSLGCMP